MTANSMPINARQLAEAMGQNPGFVSAMKWAGYEFEFGTTTTLKHALNWRRKNKHFRTTGYYRAHRRRPGGAKGERVNKSGEPTRSNGQ
jgi:hypothetical protein